MATKAKQPSRAERIAALRESIEAEHVKWRASNDEFRLRIEGMCAQLVALEATPDETEAHGA